MNAGVRARHAASITNNTRIYGIMGGSVQGGLVTRSVRGAYIRAAQRSVVPSSYNFHPRPNGPNATKYPTRNAYLFLVNKNILSKNPAGSGRVYGGIRRASRLNFT